MALIVRLQVRLLDETGMELLHSDTISVEQMRSETIGNSTVIFGEYNFTQLDVSPLRSCAY